MTFCKMHRSKTRIAGNPCVRNRVELSPNRVELSPNRVELSPKRVELSPKRVEQFTC